MNISTEKKMATIPGISHIIALKNIRNEKTFLTYDCVLCNPSGELLRGSTMKIHLQTREHLLNVLEVENFPLYEKYKNDDTVSPSALLNEINKCEPVSDKRIVATTETHAAKREEVEMTISHLRKENAEKYFKENSESLDSDGRISVEIEKAPDSSLNEVEKSIDSASSNVEMSTTEIPGSSFSDSKTYVSELAAKQGGRLPKHIVYVVDGRDFSIDKECAKQVKVVRGFKLTFDNALSFFERHDVLNKGSVIIFCCGIYSLLTANVINICKKMKCSNHVIKYSLSNVTSDDLISKALVLQNYILENTVNDQLLLCEIVPINVTAERMCSNYHMPQNSISDDDFASYLRTIEEYNKFVRHYSLLNGFRNLDLVASAFSTTCVTLSADCFDNLGEIDTKNASCNITQYITELLQTMKMKNDTTVPIVTILDKDDHYESEVAEKFALDEVSTHKLLDNIRRHENNSTKELESNENELHVVKFSKIDNSGTCGELNPILIKEEHSPTEVYNTKHSDSEGLQCSGKESSINSETTSAFTEKNSCLPGLSYIIALKIATTDKEKNSLKYDCVLCNPSESLFLRGTAMKSHMQTREHILNVMEVENLSLYEKYKNQFDVSPLILYKEICSHERTSGKRIIATLDTYEEKRKHLISTIWQLQGNMNHRRSPKLHLSGSEELDNIEDISPSTVDLVQVLRSSLNANDDRKECSKSPELDSSSRNSTDLETNSVASVDKSCKIVEEQNTPIIHEDTSRFENSNVESDSNTTSLELGNQGCHLIDSESLVETDIANVSTNKCCEVAEIENIVSDTNEKIIAYTSRIIPEYDEVPGLGFDSEIITETRYDEVFKTHHAVAATPVTSGEFVLKVESNLEELPWPKEMQKIDTNSLEPHSWQGDVKVNTIQATSEKSVELEESFNTVPSSIELYPDYKNLEIVESLSTDVSTEMLREVLKVAGTYLTAPKSFSTNDTKFADSSLSGTTAENSVCEEKTFSETPDIISTEAPIVSTEVSIIPTETPDIIALEAPVVSTEAPIIPTETPDIIALEAPVVSTEAPIIPTEAPDVISIETLDISSETPDIIFCDKLDNIKEDFGQRYEKYANSQNVRCPMKIVFLLDGRDFYLETEQLEGIKVARTTKLSFDNAISFLEKQQILNQGSVIIFCCGIHSVLTANVINVCKKKKCSNHLVRYSVIPDITSHSLITKALDLQEYILNNTISDQIMFCELVPINVSSDGKTCSNNHSFQNEIPKDKIQKYLKTVEEYNIFVAEHSRSMGFKNFEILKHSYPSLAGNVLSLDSLNVLDEIDKGNAANYISAYLKELHEDMEDHWKKQSKVFDIIDESSNENSNSINSISVNQAVSCSSSSNLYQAQENMQTSNEVNMPSEQSFENENINKEPIENQPDDDQFTASYVGSDSITIALKVIDSAAEKDGSVIECSTRETGKLIDDHSTSDNARDNIVEAHSEKSFAFVEQSIHVLDGTVDNIDSDGRGIESNETIDKAPAKFVPLQRLEGLQETDSISVEWSMEKHNEVTCKSSQENTEHSEKQNDYPNKQTLNTELELSSTTENVEIVDSSLVSSPAGISTNFEEWRSESPLTFKADLTKFAAIQNTRCPTKIVFLLDGRDFYLETEQLEGIKVARTTKLSFDNAISFLEKQQILNQGSVIIFCCGIHSVLTANVINVCKKKKCSNHLVRYSVIPDITSHSLITKALDLQEYILNNTISDQIMFCELVPINVSSDGKTCSNNHSFQNEIPKDKIQKYLKTVEEYNIFVAEHSRSMGFKNFEILKHSYPSLARNVVSPDSLNVLDEMDKGNAANYISAYLKELHKDMEDHWKKQSEVFDIIDEPSDENSTVNSISGSQTVSCRTSSNLCQEQGIVQTSNEVNMPSNLCSEDILTSNEVSTPSEQRFDNENINKEPIENSQTDDDQFTTSYVNSDSLTIALKDIDSAVEKDGSVTECSTKGTEMVTKDDHSTFDNARDNIVTIAAHPEKSVANEEQPNLHVLKGTVDDIDSDGKVMESNETIERQYKAPSKFEPLQRLDNLQEMNSISDDCTMEKRSEIETCKSSQEKIDQSEESDYPNDHTSNTESELLSTNEDIEPASVSAEASGIPINCEEWRFEPSDTVKTSLAEFASAQKNRFPTKILFLVDGRDFYLENLESVKVARTGTLSFDNAISFIEKKQILDQGSLIIFCYGILSLLNSNVANVCKRKKCKNQLCRYSLIPDVTSEVLISKALKIQEYILNNTTNDQVMFCELIPINICGDEKKCSNNHSLHNEISRDILQKYIKTVEEYNRFVSEHSRSMGFKNFEILKHSYPSLAENVLSPDSLNILDELDKGNAANYISVYLKELLKDMGNYWNKQSEEFDIIAKSSNENFISGNQSVSCNTLSSSSQEQEHIQNSNEVELRFENENINEESSRPSHPRFATSTTQSNKTIALDDQLVTDKDESVVRNSMDEEKQFLKDHSTSDGAHDTIVAAAISKNYVVCEELSSLHVLKENNDHGSDKVIDVRDTSCEMMETQNKTLAESETCRRPNVLLETEVISNETTITKNDQMETYANSQANLEPFEGRGDDYQSSQPSLVDTVNYDSCTLSEMQDTVATSEAITVHDDFTGKFCSEMAATELTTQDPTSLEPITHPTEVINKASNLDQMSAYEFCKLSEMLNTESLPKYENLTASEIFSAVDSTGMPRKLLQTPTTSAKESELFSKNNENMRNADPKLVTLPERESTNYEVNIQKDRCPTKVVFLVDGRDFYLETDQLENIKVVRTAKLTFDNAISFLEKKQILDQGSLIIFCCGIFAILNSSVANVCKRKKCPNQLWRYSLIPDVTSEILISKALDIQEYILNRTTNDQVMFCELVPINICGDGRKCGNNHSLENKNPRDVVQKYLEIIEAYNKFVAEHSRSLGFKNLEILKHSFPSMTGTFFPLDSFDVLDEMDKENVAIYISNYIKELLQNMKSRSEVSHLSNSLSLDKSKLVDDNMSVNEISSCVTSSNLSQNEEQSQISGEADKPLDPELINNVDTIVQSIDSTSKSDSKIKTIKNSDLDNTIEVIDSTEVGKPSNEDVMRNNLSQLVKSKFIPGIAYIIALKDGESPVTFDCVLCNTSSGIKFSGTELKTHTSTKTHLLNVMEVDHHEMFSKYKEDETATSTLLFEVLCNSKVSSNNRIIASPENYSSIRIILNKTISRLKEARVNKTINDSLNEETIITTNVTKTRPTRWARNNNDTRTSLEDTNIPVLECNEENLIPMKDKVNKHGDVINKHEKNISESRSKRTSENINESGSKRNKDIKESETKKNKDINKSDSKKNKVNESENKRISNISKNNKDLKESRTIKKKDINEIESKKKDINESGSKKKKKNKDMHVSEYSVLYRPLLDTTFSKDDSYLDSSNIGQMTAFQKVVLITYPQYLEYMNEFRLPWVEVVVVKPTICGGLVSFIKSKVKSYPSNTLWLTHSGLFNIANLTTSNLCRNPPCEYPLDVVSLYDEKLLNSEKFLLHVHHYVTALTEEINALSPNSTFLILPPIPPTFIKINKELHSVYHRTKQNRFYFSTEKDCKQLETLFTALSKEITMLLISQLEKLTLPRHGIEEYYYAIRELQSHAKCMDYKKFINSDVALNPQLRLWYKCIRHLIFLSVNEKDSKSLCKPVIQTSETSFPADTDVVEPDNSNCDQFKDIDYIVFLGLKEQLDLLPIDHCSSKFISLVQLKIPFKWETTETIITKLDSIRNLSSSTKILFVFMLSCKVLCKFQQKHHLCQREKCEKPLFYFNFEKLSNDELISSTLNSVQHIIKRIKSHFKKRCRTLLLPLFPIKMAKLSTIKTKANHKKEHHSLTRSNITCLVEEQGRWNTVVTNFNKHWRGKVLSYAGSVEFRNFIEWNFPQGAFPIIWWNDKDSKLMVNKEAEGFLIRQCKYFLRLLIIRTCPSVTFSSPFQIPQNFFELLIVGDVTPDQVRKLRTDKLIEYHKEFQRSCEVKRNIKVNIKYEDSKLSDIVNNIQNLRAVYNKLPFDFAYVISNKELETTVGNLENVQFICNDSWELSEADHERLLGLLGNIRTNSVCILVLEIPHLTHLMSISPTCSKFRCQQPISALISSVENIDNDSDFTMLKSFILNRISDIVTCISKLVASIPVVILPLFPARIYCDDGLSFVKHKLGHQITSPNSYTVTGNKDLWTQYASIVTGTWFDCLKLCYEKHFGLEQLLSYIKENLRFLLLEASLQKFSSEFPEIFKWNSILLALLDVLVKNKDTPMREIQDASSDSESEEIVVINLDSDSSESRRLKSRSRSGSRSSNSSRDRRSRRRSSRRSSSGNRSRSPINRSSARSRRSRSSRSHSRSRKKRRISISKSRSISPFRKQRKRSSSRDRYTKSTSRSRTSMSPVRRSTAYENKKCNETPSNKRSYSLTLGDEIKAKKLKSTNLAPEKKSADPPPETKRQSECSCGHSDRQSTINLSEIPVPPSTEANQLDKLKVKLGRELYEEFIQEKEKLTQTHKEEFDKYSKTPELHSSYELHYGEFCSEYMDVIARSTGGPQDWENIWKDFWNNKVKILEQQDWKRKEDELLNNFEFKAEVLASVNDEQTIEDKQPSKVGSSVSSTSDLPSSEISQAGNPLFKKLLISIESDEASANSNTISHIHTITGEFSIIGALTLLEQMSGKLGILGQAMVSLSQSVKETGPTSREAFTLLSNEENLSLVQMVVKKIQNLIASTPETEKPILFKALDWSVKLMNYGRKPKQEVSLNANALAVVALNKTPQFIFDLIRRAFVHEGKIEPTKEEINEVFLKICALQLELQRLEK